MRQSAICIWVLCLLGLVPSDASATAITIDTCVSTPCSADDGVHLVVLKQVGNDFDLVTSHKLGGGTAKNWEFEPLPEQHADLVTAALGSNAMANFSAGDAIRLILITAGQGETQIFPDLGQPAIPGECPAAHPNGCVSNGGGGGHDGDADGDDSSSLQVPEPSMLFLTGLGVAMVTRRNRRLARSKN